ncbi:enoyl-CoA hydratase/isomerase family protein [Candidatus Burkholderia verschuerenii]|uniref:enoyl-CoA hydratase/isomerase family protein n=1 Tax=Candidatus Burkholderia verschuerenii TaxID=242163 RepID=UPI000A612147
MTVHFRMEKSVAVLTLDAPKSMNALTVDELYDLRACLSKCQDDDAVRAIVITGAGDRAFCTGANLKATLPPEQGFASGALKSRRAESMQGGYTRLLDFSDLEIWKPMIAAVNGYCLGGGMELALQCDLRVASDTASFGLPEVKVASVPACGGVQYLLRAIPAAHAMKLALTGERIDAAEALRIGLVSDVVPATDLLSFALQLAAHCGQWAARGAGGQTACHTNRTFDAARFRRASESAMGLVARQR